MDERMARTMDLLMQVTVNAREKEADARYRVNRVNRVWRPESARMCFVEAEWLG